MQHTNAMRSPTMAAERPESARAPRSPRMPLKQLQDNSLKQESPEERRYSTLPGLTADATVFAIGSQHGVNGPACEGAKYCPHWVALEALRLACLRTECSESWLCFVRRCLQFRGHCTLTKKVRKHKSALQSAVAMRLKLDPALQSGPPLRQPASLRKHQ